MCRVNLVLARSCPICLLSITHQTRLDVHETLGVKVRRLYGIVEDLEANVPDDLRRPRVLDEECKA